LLSKKLAILETDLDIAIEAWDLTVSVNVSDKLLTFLDNYELKKLKQNLKLN
jgi:hypothetical protein